jgi:TatD DNase family protein
MVGPWFDTHVHLSDAQFDWDRDIAIERATVAGVSGMVEIADGPPEWEKAQALSEANLKNIWWAAGLHPYYADLATPDVWKKLKNLAHHPRFVAIGEVGLDYAKATVPPEMQKKTLRSAIEVSLQVNKPLIIHCRNAYEDLHPILKDFFYGTERCPGVVHCFSGTQSDADKLIAMGFYLGVDGPLTYPSANDLRAVMTNVPLSRIVLETDSPYLPPQSRRGKRNEPMHVVSVGEKLAEIRGKSPMEIAKETRANALYLYGINPAVFSA